MKWIILGITLIAVAVMTSVPASATFHLMQVERIIGGVDGDPSKQAIQLRMRAVFQNQVQLSRLIAWDAAGANPVIIATPGAPVANAGTGDHVLIATAAFSSATIPAAVPDFVMTNPIPASYLAAGSLTFEDAVGTVYWRVSWGGVGYSGSSLGSITNDADGNFGPPFGGPMPSINAKAIRFQGVATDLSTNNAADYAITTGNGVFTNNAGVSFAVQTTPTGVPGPAIEGWLAQNYPNPFNPSTQIEFSMPERAHAAVRVFDATGRLVATLVDATVDAGTMRIEWDGRDASGRAAGSGVYFYRLTTPNHVESRKMVLLK